MSYAGGGAAAAAAAAHQMRIKKMIGPVARVDEESFLDIVSLQPDLLVVHSLQGFWSKKHHYITHAFGLTWYCISKFPLDLMEQTIVFEADNISVPE